MFNDIQQDEEQVDNSDDSSCDEDPRKRGPNKDAYDSDCEENEAMLAALEEKILNIVHVSENPKKGLIVPIKEKPKPVKKPEVNKLAFK